MAVWSPSVVTVAFGLFLVINSVASQGKKPFISWACYYESFFKIGMRDASCIRENMKS